MREVKAKAKFAFMTPHFIQVIVPLPFRGVFTYQVSEELLEEIIPGKRVVVPFGPRRLISAIVYKLDVKPIKGATIRSVEYILDNEAIISDEQFLFWEWMANYYMCGLGSIMLAALPDSMRLSSQTTVILSDETVDVDQLSSLDKTILANLTTKGGTPVNSLEKIGSKASIQRSIDHLLRLGLVEIEEAVSEMIKPKMESFIVLEDDYREELKLSSLMDGLVNAPRQLELVMRYLELSGYFQAGIKPVSKNKLLNAANSNAAILNSLIKKEVFFLRQELATDLELQGVDEGFELSQAQRTATNSILEAWKTKSTVLLHGVTGSGKTLVYADIIKQIRSVDGQVLFLVPEIALTTQLVDRLRRMLDEEVLVYHSRFSNKERLTMWMQLRSATPPRIIIGARSCVFLPFKKIDLVIVDEEHESSYKQNESPPFYNAKDSAIWLAHLFKAKVLLGSATPTVQSYSFAQQGKYALVELKDRYGQIKLPKIELSDLRKSLADKKMKGDFTPETALLIQQTVQHKKQVIIFQNRRGYAPYQICQACGWSAECMNCDVNLTYHKFFEKLLCHYCGFSLKQPKHCPQCGSAKLVVKGYGTEKIEDDLEILFPDARIARMDLDTTRKKKALENIITAFHEGSYDILVGTQMVTKGLDFENVALVVVMTADSLWSRPDFRAFERAYQLLTQVAGRAGRKTTQGKVVIQAYNLEHSVLSYVMRNDYKSMYDTQMLERRTFNYPPFSRMIRIQLSHPDAKLTRQAADYMAKDLKTYFGDRLLGPEEPPIARIRNRFIRQMFVKLETNLSAQKSRDAIWKCVDAMEGHVDFRKVRLYIDVDPL